MNHKLIIDRKLALDNDFKPTVVSDGDEIFPNGIFEFNITKMIDFINSDIDTSIIKESVDVKTTRSGFSRINEEHLSSVDISIPIILAEISPGRYNVIDGNHRLEKAFRMGKAKIWAYKLGPSQHIKFLITKKGYEAYIEYWNNKLLNMRPEI